MDKTWSITAGKDLPENLTLSIIPMFKGFYQIA